MTQPPNRCMPIILTLVVWAAIALRTTFIVAACVLALMVFAIALLYVNLPNPGLEGMISR